MSNSKETQLVRPKKIVVTSDEINDFNTSSRAIFNFVEGIHASDNFKFAYGVTSLGFSTSAWNISENQKNNKLIYSLKYSEPKYIYNKDTGTFTQSSQNEYENVYGVTIPDGYYGTLDELFDVMNDPHHVSLLTGIHYDLTLGSESDKEVFNESNNLTLNVVWGAYPNGFKIRLDLDLYRKENDKITNFYLIDDDGDYGYDAYLTNPRLISLEILPAEKNSFFSLLFKNYSDKINRPCSAPSLLPAINLKNPPDKIVFNIDYKFGSNKSYSNTNPELDKIHIDNSIPEIDKLTGFHFTVYEEPNTEINKRIHNVAPIIPSTMINYPYISYYKPLINPLYIDIQSDLESTNLIESGASKNILLRQFLPGNNQGIVDFYETWENPAWIYTDRTNINSIVLEWSSEQNKWDFFNLRFVLEITFYEYQEEMDDNDILNEQFNLPQADPLTETVNQYIGPTHNPSIKMKRIENRGVLNVRNTNKKMRR